MIGMQFGERDAPRALAIINSFGARRWIDWMKDEPG